MNNITKTKTVKTTVVYQIEAETREEALELASDENYLLSQLDEPSINIISVKCLDVSEVEPGYYDITCEIVRTEK